MVSQVSDWTLVTMTVNEEDLLFCLSFVNVGKLDVTSNSNFKDDVSFDCLTLSGLVSTLPGGSKRWTFSEMMDIGRQSPVNRDFTVCIIRCVYRAELILGR